MNFIGNMRIPILGLIALTFSGLPLPIGKPQIFLQANLQSSAYTKMFCFGYLFVLQPMIVLTSIVRRSMYMKVRRFKLWRKVSDFFLFVCWITRCWFQYHGARQVFFRLALMYMQLEPRGLRCGAHIELATCYAIKKFAKLM